MAMRLLWGATVIGSSTENLAECDDAADYLVKADAQVLQHE